MTSRPDLPLSRGRWLCVVLAVFALAATTRAAFLWQVRDDPVYVSLGHDEAVNDQVARAILAREMPAASFYKAPLYMYGLAGVDRLLGEEPGRVRWVQVFVDSLSAILLALIGRRLFGWVAGLIAGILGALFWSFVFYSTELVDTSLACTLYLLLAYLMLALPEGRWMKWLICGIVLGLGAITRPNILAFAPVLAVVVLITRLRKARGQYVGEAEIVSPTAEAAGHPVGRLPESRTPNPEPRTLSRSAWPSALASVIALGFGIALALSPVTLHNWIVGGEWVPIATYGGLNFYVANSPYSDCKNGPLLVTDGVPDASTRDPNNLWSRLDLNYNIARSYAQNQVGRTLKMGEVDRFFNRLTVKYIRSDPKRFLGNCLKRFCWFFNRYEFANVKDPYRLCRVSPLLSGLSWFHYGVLCPLAILGLIFALKAKEKAPGAAYYLAMLASLFLPGLFFVMNSRYRLPTVYLLAPFAAYGVIRFIELWRRPMGWPARIGACAALAGVGVFSNLNLFGYATSDHTELLITYAQGCLKTHRNDLLAEAAPQFEQAYWAEVAAGGRPWAATLYHSKPFTWLFAFYHQLGSEEKAMKYGRLMVQSEPMSPVGTAFFNILLKQKRQEEARKVLDALEATVLEEAPGAVVQAFLDFWERFQDDSVLVRAEKLLIKMSKMYPDDPTVRYKLRDVRHLLHLTGAASRPASAPATRPATQETSG